MYISYFISGIYSFEIMTVKQGGFLINEMREKILHFTLEKWEIKNRVLLANISWLHDIIGRFYVELIR